MTQIARDKVKGPATGLKVVAALSAVGSVLSIVLNALGVGMGSMEQESMAWMSGAVGIVLNLIGLGLAAFVWIAAGKMADLKGYNQALVASILAMLPCSLCCIIGLPIGIWSVVVLSNGEVKSAFTPG
jgi:hypothetical protein